MALKEINYWLMKSEPDAYSIKDLEKEEETLWDGIRNYQARNFMRSMEIGDQAFFYHSNTIYCLFCWNSKSNIINTNTS